MTERVKSEPQGSSHVVLTYRDDEPDEEGQHSMLLSSNIPSSAPTLRRRGWCCKRIIICLALISICIGAFELAYHGKEAESLRAVRDHISRLQDTVSQRLKHTYDRVTTTTSDSTLFREAVSVITAEDTKAELVKSRSVIVLKTGASVLFDRLPVQLLQAQSALHPELYRTGQSDYRGPAFLVYSDAATTLGPFTVHNALANVSARVRADPEFSSRYNALHRLLSSSSSSLSSFNEGWNLDKWKFLYMWADAYRLNPTSDWYIGYEADTYVLWTSLFRFLSTQDPTQEQLFGCGSILMRNQELFANGGCPYVISGALMRATYGKDPNFAQRFDGEVQKSCCGDAELSIALRKSASVPIKNLAESGARFQGDRPWEILFNAENWCQPILSFHHLKSQEVQWLAKVEQEVRQGKTKNQTVLYSDIFDHVIPPQLQHALAAMRPGFNTSEKVERNPIQEDWEAFSSSDKGVAPGRRVADANDCKLQCIDAKGCLGWFWIKPTEQDSDGDCYMMKDGIRIGKAYEGTGLRTSGWIGDRVASFKAHHFCKNPPSA